MFYPLAVSVFLYGMEYCTDPAGGLEVFVMNAV